jgi:hypothetical protein
MENVLKWCEMPRFEEETAVCIDEGTVVPHADIRAGPI